MVPCPFCGKEIDATAYFCPLCGRKVREKPIATGFWAQTGVYLLSLLLPPFGIGTTLKYLKSPDNKAKNIGRISLVLTVAALVIVGYLTYVYTKNLSLQVEQEMKKYQGYGSY